MHILTKVGNQDNVVTYEHICDTLQDRDNIERRYITLGSTCLVLSGENDTIEVYMADSNKEWHDVAVSGGSGGGSGSGGLQLYVCTSSEVQDGKPAVEIPMEDVLYLVPGGTEGNLYTEYMYVNNNWELFGGANVDLTNYASKQWVQDQHYLTSYTETDPTVPAWAKTSSKPTYTANEVGAATQANIDSAIDNLIVVSSTQPQDNGTKIWIDTTGGQTIQIPTVAEMNSAIPQSTSQLVNDSGFVSVTGDPESFTGDEIPIYTIDAEAGTATWDPVPFGELVDGYMQDHPLSINGDDITPIELENNHDTHGDYFVTPTYYLASIAGIGQRVPVQISDVDSIIGKPLRYHNGNETFTNMSKNIVNGVTEITVGKDIYVEDAETHILVFDRRVAASVETNISNPTSGQILQYNSTTNLWENSDSSFRVVQVAETTPTILAENNTQYICGTVTTLSFTPANSGVCDIIFTSGSTATVLTIPNTLKFPEWFDPTTLETNMIYEINVMNGTYGTVISWPTT